MITAQDLTEIATVLVERHGPVAVDYADRAVGEMAALGDRQRLASWMALRAVVADIVDGRLSESEDVTVH